MNKQIVLPRSGGLAIRFLALLVAGVMLCSPAMSAEKKKARKISPSEAEARALYPTSPAERQPFFVLPKRQSTPAPNMMMPNISAEAKRNFMQAMNMYNPLSLREMMNLFAYKVKASPGLSYDDVVETLKLRANELNFKFVSHNPLYKDVVAITGKPTSRVEIFSFCDAMVAREALDYSLEFVAFLPCRISVLEDAKKQIWLVTQDWDMLWLDTSPNPDIISQKLRKSAIHIRQVMYTMMNAAARGEF